MQQKKILAFGASNSSRSINHQFALWAAHKLKKIQIIEYKLCDLDIPLFGVDLEKRIGKNSTTRQFLEIIKECDGIIISLAEHNGSYTVAFKNLLDWSSRIDGKVWQNKPILALSTSPGKRGGASVMNAFVGHMPYMGAQIIGHFSLPRFKENFDASNGILDNELDMKFNAELDKFFNSMEILRS